MWYARALHRAGHRAAFPSVPTVRRPPQPAGFTVVKAVSCEWARKGAGESGSLQHAKPVAGGGGQKEVREELGSAEADSRRSADPIQRKSVVLSKKRRHLKNHPGVQMLAGCWSPTVRRFACLG